MYRFVGMFLFDSKILAVTELFFRWNWWKVPSTSCCCVVKYCVLCIFPDFNCFASSKLTCKLNYVRSMPAVSNRKSLPSQIFCHFLHNRPHIEWWMTYFDFSKLKFSLSYCAERVRILTAIVTTVFAPKCQKTRGNLPLRSADVIKRHWRPLNQNCQI